MNTALIKILLSSSCLIFYIPISTAEQLPLIAQLIENSQPSQQEIIKAKKQLQGKTELKLQDNLSLQPFHKRIANKINNTNSKNNSYCTSCHLAIPHNKSLRTRSFNNMHTQFIACETCHFKPEKIELNYRWYDYALETEANALPGRLHSGRQQNDKTPLIARNGKIKIAPFNRHRPALITQEHDFSLLLQQQWEKANSDKKAEIKAQIHQPLTAQGNKCTDCHTNSNDLLNITLLADSQEQAESIQRNTIANFFKHYQVIKTPGSATQSEPEQRIKITDLLN